MNNPLLTIAVPTWNRADILDLALTALLPQIIFYNNEIEIVISDNASTDNTDQVIKSQIEKNNGLNIIHHIQSENTGYYGNFKTCRELSNGDYFWLLSDNDYVAKGLIEYIMKILSPKRPSFIFLKDWKHNAKVSDNSNFNNRVYSVKEAIETFNYKTTLISAVIFNNDKSNDATLFETFNGNTFLGFAYFLQSLKNKDQAYEITGTSLFINDTKVSFNAFKSFAIDLRACLNFAVDQNILSKESESIFINKVISELTVKHYILYRVTGALHGKKHRQVDVDVMLKKGFDGYEEYHNKLEPLQKAKGIKFYVLVITKHLFKIINQRFFR